MPVIVTAVTKIINLWLFACNYALKKDAVSDFFFPGPGLLFLNVAKPIVPMLH